MNEAAENDHKDIGDKIVTKEQIEEVEENYVDFIDEFIDTVFESDSLLSRQLWEEQVSKKASWIVQSDKIRKKFYPHLYIKKKSKL